MPREARGASRDAGRRTSRAAGGVRESAAASIALVVGLALVFLLLLADIEAVAYHEDAYRDSLTAGDTAVQTGLDVDDLLLVVHRVLDYATGRRPDLQFDLAVLDRGEAGRLAFTPRELEHMADVRELFGVARVCRWVAFGVVAVGLVLLAWLDPGDWGVRVARGLRTGAVLSVLVCAFLAAAAVVSFSVFWTAFHEVLFSNDLWLLPADSLLIRLMPEALFERLALEAVGLLTAELVAIIVLTSSYLSLRSRAARPAARPSDTLKGVVLR